MTDRRDAIDMLRGGDAGIQAWNLSRENGEPIPDLTHENLSRVALDGVNLSRAVARGSEFGGSYLIGADLSEADLRQADFSACQLCRANLRGADLRGAVLRSADVFEADFTDADMRGATVVTTNLSVAVLHVFDVSDTVASMRRVERLPLDEDVIERLLEALQKLDILNDAATKRRPEIAGVIESAIKEMLKPSSNADRIAGLSSRMSGLAPQSVRADSSDSARESL